MVAVNLNLNNYIKCKNHIFQLKDKDVQVDRETKPYTLYKTHLKLKVNEKFKIKAFLEITQMPNIKMLILY